MDGYVSGFKRVLFLVRNPYRAIFAEFQRSQTVGHAQALDMNHFDQIRNNYWPQVAMNAAKMFEITWKEKILPTLRTLQNFKDYERVMILKYEDLTNKETRASVVLKVLKFLYPSKEVSMARVKCAFLLSDSPRIHRRKTNSTVNVTYAFQDRDLVHRMWNHLQQFATDMGYNSMEI
jgi:hypothetical protein